MSLTVRPGVKGAGYLFIEGHEQRFESVLDREGGGRSPPSSSPTHLERAPRASLARAAESGTVGAKRCSGCGGCKGNLVSEVIGQPAAASGHLLGGEQEAGGARWASRRAPWSHEERLHTATSDESQGLENPLERGSEGWRLLYREKTKEECWGRGERVRALP